MELSSNLAHHYLTKLKDIWDYMGSWSTAWKELLREVMNFENRTKHHEEEKEQMTMVLILWSTSLFAALIYQLETESFLTDCPFFYKCCFFLLQYTLFYFFGCILEALPNTNCLK